MTDDAELLLCFARDRSETAFATLVHRHINLVYGAALRRLGGDAHSAMDVTQTVFCAVAKNAGLLSRHPALTGWLYTATRNGALKVRVSEQRRRLREQEASAMEEVGTATEPALDWERLRPVLDSALDELAADDREALLLRFFEGSGYATIAAALRTSEESARKRVDRALDKLRLQFSRRGITSSSVVIGEILANQPSFAAPAGLSAAVTSSALATSAALGGSGTAMILALLKFMITAKNSLPLALALVALAGTGVGVFKSAQARRSEELAGRSRSELALLDSRQVSAEGKLVDLSGQLAAAQANASAFSEPRPETAAAPQAQRSYVRPPQTPARARMVQKIKESHAGYLAQFALPPEDAEDLAQALSDFGNANSAAQRNALREGVTLAGDPGRFQYFLEAARAPSIAAIKSIVGDEGYQALLSYRATSPERPAVNKLYDLQTWFDDNKASLTPDQRAQLLQLLIATTAPTARGMATVDFSSAVDPSVASRAAGFLTAEQIQVLTRAIESQRKMQADSEQKAQEIQAAKSQVR